MLLFLEEYQLRTAFSFNMSNTLFPLDLFLCLSGRVDWTMEGCHEQFKTRRGQCELTIAEQSHGLSTYSADEPLVMVSIMLGSELLRAYFNDPLAYPDNDEFMKRQEDGKEIIYGKFRIPGYIQQTLQQLMRSPCVRRSDKLRFQGKILEIIAFQMEQLEKPGLAISASRETSDDGNMVARAKSILKSRIQSPPSLKHLAHFLGTNETKLKKLFIDQCGTTAYGYLTTCRMNRACELLEDSSLTMSYIGDELGYSARTHFSRAFSRYYGISPSQYRLRLQRLSSGL